MANEKSEHYDAYADLGGNVPPTADEFLMSQALMGVELTTNDAGKVFTDEQELEEFNKNINPGYWKAIRSPIKIRSKYNQLIADMRTLGMAFDKRLEELEAEGINPKLDVEAVRMAAKLKLWGFIKETVNSDPQLNATIERQ
jgi:hypothetical protein